MTCRGGPSYWYGLIIDALPGLGLAPMSLGFCNLNCMWFTRAESEGFDALPLLTGIDYFEILIAESLTMQFKGATEMRSAHSVWGSLLLSVFLLGCAATLEFEWGKPRVLDQPT